ncbi:energy transducer TonB, partial [Azotobacter chroococcum]|nr:energy transducer TonB [Azotobacter chroococcum]
LARKRVEERKREQQRIERQRLEQEQREQERQRREAEALAQRQAESAERASAERVRAAAEAAERSRAEAASRQYLPIAKQAPDYPESALDRGIEGDCTVGYRVNPLGRVENPQVVGDCHPLFVRPSLAAARTFRYQPRIVDGQAVAVPDVKNTFHYRIQEKNR